MDGGILLNSKSKDIFCTKPSLLSLRCDKRRMRGHLSCTHAHATGRPKPHVLAVLTNGRAGNEPAHSAAAAAAAEEPDESTDREVVAFARTVEILNRQVLDGQIIDQWSFRLCVHPHVGTCMHVRWGMAGGCAHALGRACGRARLSSSCVQTPTRVRLFPVHDKPNKCRQAVLTSKRILLSHIEDEEDHSTVWMHYWCVSACMHGMSVYARVQRTVDCLYSINIHMHTGNRTWGGNPTS